MEYLIDMLIKTDWAKIARYYKQKIEEKGGMKKREYGYMCDEENNDEEDNYHYFNEIDFDLLSLLSPLLEKHIMCQAVSFDSNTSPFSMKNDDQ